MVHIIHSVLKWHCSEPYGERGFWLFAMRHQFRQAGFAIYQASAKRVHDAKEIFDGVPSLHDAKAACLIAKLHKEGLTKPWHELDEAGRELNAARREYELHQSHYERNQNRLEAYLSRHWPEALALFELDSVTLEKLLIAYGSPQAIAADAERAAQQMKGWGGHFLSAEKIARVIASAIRIAQWYQAKADPKVKMKTVIACLRKLAKALWYVARGERFDARKLVTL